MKRSESILFICEASVGKGFGHLMRSMAVAQSCREKLQYKIIFLLPQLSLGTEKIVNQGFEIAYIPINTNPLELIYATIEQKNVKLLFIDGIVFFEEYQIKALRSKVAIVCIDESTDIRLQADVVFYPPVPQLEKMSWNGFSGRIYAGWEWVPLRAQFALNRNKIKIPKDASRIFIAMGGTDPHNMTELALSAIEKNSKIKIYLVAGTEVIQRQSVLQEIGVHLENILVFSDCENVADVMDECGYAICTYGVTVFELVCRGVFPLIICHNDDQRVAASMFEEKGVGKIIGLAQHVSIHNIAESMKWFESTKNILTVQSEICQQTIDGKGSARIAEVIGQTIQKRGNHEIL
jgi:spore coat polysaccharide biosynthesis predicted glycosyltransferase SpsG